MNPTTLLFILAVLAIASAVIALLVRKTGQQQAAERELYWQHKLAISKFIHVYPNRNNQ